MKGKMGTSGLMAVGILGLLPGMGLGLKVEDFSAVLTFVMWVLIGLLVVKVLAIFAGVS